MSVASQKNVVPSILISVQGTGINQLESGQENMEGWSNVVTFFSAKKSLTKADWCAGALSLRRNQLLVLHFFETFPSDRIPKTTKIVSVHFFIRSSNFFTSYHRISVFCISEFRDLFQTTTFGFYQQSQTCRQWP